MTRGRKKKGQELPIIPDEYISLLGKPNGSNGYKYSRDQVGIIIGVSGSRVDQIERTLMGKLRNVPEIVEIWNKISIFDDLNGES